MYIYNVTTNVEESIEERWVKWMKNEHIPEMLETKKFTKALMTKILVTEEMGGVTYSVQYSAINREMLKKYYEEDAPLLRSKSKEFEGKLVVFRTELEVITEQ